jgi:O-antigen ligase
MSLSPNTTLGRKRLYPKPLRPIQLSKVSRFGVIPKERLPNVLRWPFLLFIFTLPFETSDLGITSKALALSKLTGLMFFVIYFFYHNPLVAKSSPKNSFPAPPPAFWGFAGYIALFAVHGLLFSNEFFGSVVGRLLTLLQLIVFFWIASRILQEEKLARTVLLTFVSAVIVVAFGMLLNLPGFSESVSAIGEQRDTALGYNANVLGAMMALAAVILVGLTLCEVTKRAIVKALLLALTLPVLIAIVATGSRGAMAVFLVGSAVYLLPYWRQANQWVAAVTLATCGIVAMIFLVIHSPTALTRWQKTLEEGHSSGRDRIFSSATEMFRERPLFGWGPYEFQVELGRRQGIIFGQKDAHNLYTHLLMEVGLVGAAPFMIGLWLCARGAWRARKGSFGLLPLALLLTVFASNLTGTDLALKQFWLVLAITVSAGAVTPIRQRVTQSMFQATPASRGAR